MVVVFILRSFKVTFADGVSSCNFVRITSHSIIPIIAGAIKPSSGTAFIDGMDIRLHSTKTRGFFGYCPQDTALFPYLTVEENIWFISKVVTFLTHSRRAAKTQGFHDSFKSNTSFQIRDVEDPDEAVLTILMQFQLFEIKDAFVRHTTHGEKRRIQVGIAMLEEPQVGYPFMWSPEFLQ